MSNTFSDKKRETCLVLVRKGATSLYKVGIYPTFIV